MLQDRVSELDPEHVSPPFAGAGLVQLLECVWLPPPHVLVQVVKADQSLQLPSMLSEKIVVLRFETFKQTVKLGYNDHGYNEFTAITN